MSPTGRRVLRELTAVTGFGLYLGAFAVLFFKIGWLGFWLAVAMLTGSLLIFLVGLPRLLTEPFDLPPDTRERLGWDQKKPQR